MEAVRVEDTKIDERIPHLIAVEAQDPGSPLVFVPEHPCVGGPVSRVCEPSVPTRLIGLRLVLALEPDVLEAKAE